MARALPQPPRQRHLPHLRSPLLPHQGPAGGTHLLSRGTAHFNPQTTAPVPGPVLVISSKAAPPNPLLTSVTEDISSGHEAGQAASENREVRAGKRVYPAACLLKFSGGNPPNKGQSEGRRGSSDSDSDSQRSGNPYSTPGPPRAASSSQPCEVGVLSTSILHRENRRAEWLEK